MIFYRLAFAVAQARRRRRATALVFPEPILPMHTIWKTCMLLGLRIVRSPLPDTPDVTVYWEDATITTGPAAGSTAINARCTNIGKDIVERRFAEVFGYPLAIDPANHVGPYVRKSRENFAHDGTIRSGPVDTSEQRYVYERLIGNTVDDGWQVMDMRTAIVGSRIPVVFLLFRSITDRFGTDSRRAVVVSPDSVFSAEEQRLILALATAMELQFGELDVLRDAADGRIYIVDVNKTPTGPPRPLTLGERHRSMRLIANAFAAEYLAEQPAGRQA